MGPLPMPSEQVLYVVPIADFLSSQPPPGLTIGLCRLQDIECTAPTPVQPMPVPMTPPVVVGIPIPYGFEGYLKLNATDYVPTDYYFSGPMIGSPPPQRTAIVRGEAIPMLTQATRENLYGDVMQTRTPGTGILAIRAINCLGARAADVALETLTPGLVDFGWSLVANLPSGGDPPVTTTRGVAGFGNVRPGSVQVQGLMGDTAFGRNALRVKGDQLTVGEVRNDIDTYGR
jgi:hypothetical protein